MPNTEDEYSPDIFFKTPVPRGLLWKDIKSVLVNQLGADVSEGADSRVSIVLNGGKAILHRLHSPSVVDVGTILAIRHLLDK